MRISNVFADAITNSKIRNSVVVMTSIMPVVNENRSSTSRVTKEGRHLTYELIVIQQPERARACGSGAKCLYQKIS